MPEAASRPLPPARMPRIVNPMLAQLAAGVPRDGEGYGLEFKWDGFRMIAFLEGGKTRFVSRGQQDYTSRLGPLSGVPRSLRDHEGIFDGEVVAFGAGGGISFQALQNAIGPRPAGELTAAGLGYMVFDVLHWDGESLLKTAYSQRRDRLEALEIDGPYWAVPPASRRASAEGLLAQSRKLGLEGIVAKRLDSPYEAGRRTGKWLKVKLNQRQEFVIAGWLEGEGNRAGRIGALLLAYYDLADPARPQLVYGGKVGTGFSWKTLADLGRRLAALGRPHSPLERGPAPQMAHWVQPSLVCEVEFTEWTSDGEIRHPSFKGLRTDKDARLVVREDPIRV